MKAAAYIRSVASDGKRARNICLYTTEDGVSLDEKDSTGESVLPKFRLHSK